MSRGQQTIASLLALVVVLVGLDIYAHRAKAQPQIEILPRAVGVAAVGGFGQHVLYRVWTDGTVERNEYYLQSNCQGFCGWEDVPE